MHDADPARAGDSYAVHPCAVRAADRRREAEGPEEEAGAEAQARPEEAPPLKWHSVWGTPHSDFV